MTNYNLIKEEKEINTYILSTKENIEYTFEEDNLKSELQKEIEKLRNKINNEKLN